MIDPRRLLERDIERQLSWGSKAHARPLIFTANPDTGSLLDTIDLHGEAYTACETASGVGSAGMNAPDAALKPLHEHIRRHSPPAELAIACPVLVPTGIGFALDPRCPEGALKWLSMDGSKE